MLLQEKLSEETDSSIISFPHVTCFIIETILKKHFKIKDTSRILHTRVFDFYFIF